MPLFQGGHSLPSILVVFWCALDLSLSNLEKLEQDGHEFHVETCADDSRVASLSISRVEQETGGLTMSASLYFDTALSFAAHVTQFMSTATPQWHSVLCFLPNALVDEPLV